MTRQRVYLAGPDVFRPDAAEYGRGLVALCAEHGFEGVFPLAELPPGLHGQHAIARHIYVANIAHIDACDAVIANLDFHRGAEPDSGTCFEVGYAIAKGKRVIGYVPQAGSFAERIRACHPEHVKEKTDSRGWQLEEFGLPLNLMLAVPCQVVVGGPREALRALQT